jgi:endogenous inhibitor of DNA gyrase (YacG/DUF329 family)
MTATVASYLACPHCGTQNRSEETTCYACKRPLHTLPAAESGTTEVPAAAAYQVNCPSCGRRVRLAADLYRRVKDGETAVRCSQCSAALDISSADPEPAQSPATLSPPPSPSPSGLHGLGWLLVVVGAIGLVVSLLMDTTIASSSSYGSSYGGLGLDRVHNLGLLARQVVVSIASGLTLVVGAIFVAAGYLSDLRESAWKR